MSKNYDFAGWATRNNIRCSDGRTIRRDAFKDNDGQTVPLVWNHNHNDPFNVLGHALLKNRPEGVYAYCTLNDSAQGKNARELVEHGDVESLSIYANNLRQNGGDVMHGKIREVSLVLAGANPGAYIDSVIVHSDDDDSDDSEAIIYSGSDLELSHADTKKKAEDEEETGSDDNTENKEAKMAKDKQQPNTNGSGNEETVEEVFNTLTDKQKQVVYALIGMAIEDAKNGNLDDEEESEPEDEEDMKHNVFDGDYGSDVISHAEQMDIIADGKRYGSLRDSALAHGIDNIDYLFPDAQSLENAPSFVKRPDEWVTDFMNSTHHTPFSRIKSIYANITEDEARARGYIKGHQKKDEVFALLRRTTTPTTIYKKQKLDRDDIVDITDFDVVSWLKTEMRQMLDEEIARACLLGDGRKASDEDKISELNIRPIFRDNSFYTIKMNIAYNEEKTTADDLAKAFIRAAVTARSKYRGSGNPTLYTSEEMLTSCLLLEDKMGRVIYDSQEKLANAMRVSKILTVPAISTTVKESEIAVLKLFGIIVNPSDYNIGADKGGAVNMFDDFDIDYNQQKYLIETRCSGALTIPFSAITIAGVYSKGEAAKDDPVTPEVGEDAGNDDWRTSGNIGGNIGDGPAIKP